MNVYPDKELSIIGYLIEIKMFSSIYKELPIDKTIETYKKNINERMKELFKYRLLVSNIICIISTWEQQLYDYINLYYNNQVKNDFKTLRNEFVSNLQIPKTEFDKIDEFRCLENALKHGKGDSYDKLVKMGSKFIQNNPNFTNLKYENVLLLNIDANTIFDLCDILEKFWLFVRAKTI